MKSQIIKSSSVKTPTFHLLGSNYKPLTHPNHVYTQYVFILKYKIHNNYLYHNKSLTLVRYKILKQTIRKPLR